jgi:hypothetical protein
MISTGEMRERAFRFAGDRKCLNPRGTHELRFGNKGSLRITISGERAGFVHDYESGLSYSLLDKTEINRPLPVLARKRGVSDDPERRAKMAEILSGLISVEGTVGERYLRGRSIAKWPHAIRFDPRANALVALAQDAGGAVRALQRVYLDRDGNKRQITIDGNLVAKSTHMEGPGWPDVAAARFPGRGHPILCEGPETGLSIWLATGRPVFPCLGNAGFDRLYLRGKAFTLASDGDEPGSPADKRVHRAIDNRKRAGFKVKLATPPAGTDFNDVHQRDGLEVVDAIIRAAEVR